MPENSKFATQLSHIHTWWRMVASYKLHEYLARCRDLPLKNLLRDEDGNLVGATFDAAAIIPWLEYHFAPAPISIDARGIITALSQAPLVAVASGETGQHYVVLSIVDGQHGRKRVRMVATTPARSRAYRAIDSCGLPPEISAVVARCEEHERAQRERLRALPPRTAFAARLRRAMREFAAALEQTACTASDDDAARLMRLRDRVSVPWPHRLNALVDVALRALPLSHTEADDPIADLYARFPSLVSASTPLAALVEEVRIAEQLRDFFDAKRSRQRMRWAA